MKKILFLLTTACFTLAAWSQNQSVVLKTQMDTVNYLIGTSVYNFYSQQGVKQIDTKLVAQAIDDKQAGKPDLIDPKIAQEVMNSYFQQIKKEEAAINIKQGQELAEKNKQNPNIKTTASGLQYEVLQEGTGAKPTAADTVTVNYKGTLLDGTEFDNSYKRGQPISFPLGGVIRGWTEGVQLMPIGSKYKFYIPYELGYGENGTGPIPGGATLIFEVDLLDIKSATTK